MNLDLFNGVTAAFANELADIAGNDRSRGREGDLLIRYRLQG